MTRNYDKNPGEKKLVIRG